jgi:predicted nucleic acid-binding protein
MKRPKSTPTAAPRCVLDSGGVTALLGRSQAARAWLRWVVTHGGDIVIPTPVLAECTTGQASRDAEVNRVLGVLDRFGSALVAPQEKTARLAGTLRFAARTDDGIDALVAAEAATEHRASVLLTSDPKDLERLLANTAQVSVRRV